MKRSRLFPARIVALALLGAIVLAGCGALSSGDDPTPGPSPTPLPGTVLDPPKDLEDFTLTDQAGDPLSLSDLRGEAVVMFFGYTHCPDICPTTIADFKRVKADLGDDASKVAFVFVSVDPDRDTPGHLATYLGNFDPDFIGITGDELTLRGIAQQFGVFFQRSNYDESGDNYLVDHTASTFVVGPEGRLRIVYPYDTDPSIIADGIRKLL
ncbi:MAG TPA: SCO family protein [Aggregatilinea sp.]|uniref:SCO family protein n=1 Tax=Aggregatilinea sp. TaxID=2806333 RepID=UPI002CB218A3|nr:SCO family protein [Aggregatilinea sp.]HML24809.1 SCO family protein [Aggregatilinea sp.]